MLNFVQKYSIINNNQYEFRKQHNITHAILTFINKIYTNYKNSEKIDVFLDLKKAHNSVPHEIFLGKLEMQGFTEIIGNWLETTLKIQNTL